jgi:hypothetical protein
MFQDLRKQVTINNSIVSDYLGQDLAIKHSSKARAILQQLLTNKSTGKTGIKPVSLLLTA